MHRPGEFEPHERFDAIAFGEAVETATPVLADALDQVRGNAGVERAVARAGGDIGAGLEVGVHGVEARAAMNLASRWTSDGPRPGVTTLSQTGWPLVIPDSRIHVMWQRSRIACIQLITAGLMAVSKS